jgi:transcriptional regulator with XRE-family HTH domain
MAADFGERLRTFRQAAGLTQQDLADRVRCSRKQVGRWEGGETCPGRARLLQLEAPLGLAPGTLVDVLESLDSQARGHRMRRLSWLLEESFASDTGPPEEALLYGSFQPLPVAESRLSTSAEVVEALIQLAVAGCQSLPAGGERVTLILGPWMAGHIERHNAKRRWKAALQALLSSGWCIQHLWTHPSGPAVEEWILNFLGFKGRYELNNVGRGGVTPSFVLLDIPGVGGLIAFVRRNHPDVSAWVATSGPILELVHDAAGYALSAAQWEPSRQFNQFQASDEVAPGLSRARLDFEVQIAIGEKLPGEQLIVKDGLINASEPEAVAIRVREDQLASAVSGQAAALHSYYEARLQRIRRFKESIESEGVRAICSPEAIDEFVATGSWPVDPFPGTVQDPLLRKAWIENVIRLLKQHPRSFRLALVDRQAKGFLRRAYWHVVGDRCLLFAAGPPTSRGIAFGYSFDPDVVTTFRGIFEDLWETLPLSSHDTRLVIARLERAIRRRPRQPRSVAR